MQTRDVITQLVLEDLKFNQFLERLEQMDITMEYQPDLMHLVARLQGIDHGKISDTWMDIYAAYIQKAFDCAYHDTEALWPLAQECTQQLDVELFSKE